MSSIVSLPCVDNYLVGSIININNIYYELINDVNNNKIWIKDEDFNNLNYEEIYSESSSDDENTEIFYKNIKINFDTKKKQVNNSKVDSSIQNNDIFIIKEKKPRGRPPKNTKLNIKIITHNNNDNIILKKVVKKLVQS